MKVYFVWSYCCTMGLPRWCNGKESTCQCKRCKRQGTGSISWVRKMPWSRKWQPTSVFLPGKFHGQRSLAGYSPWGLQRVECTHTLLHNYNTFTCPCCYSRNMKLRPAYLDSVLDDVTVNQNIISYLNIFLKKNLKCELSVRKVSVYSKCTKFSCLFICLL